MTGKETCLWCGGKFAPRRSGGSAQRFCSASCRQRFHTAARRWVSVAVATGKLTVDELKDSTAPCTLVREPSKGSPVLEPLKAAE